MGTRSKFIIAFSLLFALLGITSLGAQWVLDGTAVSTATGSQERPRLISDGAGGAFIVWYDGQSGNYDIYAQRIDSNGYVLWQIDGVPICTYTGNQVDVRIASDCDGGAIITWQDQRAAAPDIYAQRIDTDGVIQWTIDGVAVCTEVNTQEQHEMASDGRGGLISAWEDRRSNGDNDIYAQRIDATGDTLWAEDGIAVCDTINHQWYPDIISDGAGGAVIAWHDLRGSSRDIYAQRVDTSGVTLWAKNGIAVCMAAGDQKLARLASDSAGGAIVTWEDYRNGNQDIYAQRIDAYGDTLWIEDGMAICIDPANQAEHRIIPDGMGGAIIAWEDSRNGNQDIYAQRIDAIGDILWTADGVAVCTETGNQGHPSIASDGSGGAIIAWYDERNGNRDVYAQAIDADGNVRWDVDGVAICTETGDQEYPQIESDSDGNAIIAWQDIRSVDYDIYAQRIDHHGIIGHCHPPYISAVQDVPNDQGGKILLQWEHCSIDTFPNTEITHYSAWRRLPIMERGVSTEEVEKGVALDIPIDFRGSAIRLTNGGFTWEWLANVPALHFDSYSLVVTSLYDSMGTDPGWQYFMVSAHTEKIYVFYDSPIDSGYSVDNLSPFEPLGFEGSAIYGPPGLRLSWEPNTETDLSYYAIYRGASEDFIPGPVNLIASTTDTTCIDNYLKWANSYYKLAALDVHGNESSHALLRPEDVAGTDDPDLPHATYLAQNYPNPFNPFTKIAFGIKEPARVSLRIYDPAGRIVRVLVDGRKQPGRYEERWDGKDGEGRTIASGVYFYRLVANEFVETRKMVILR